MERAKVFAQGNEAGLTPVSKDPPTAPPTSRGSSRLLVHRMNRADRTGHPVEVKHPPAPAISRVA